MNWQPGDADAKTVDGLPLLCTETHQPLVKSWSVIRLFLPSTYDGLSPFDAGEGR